MQYENSSIPSVPTGPEELLGDLVTGSGSEDGGSPSLTLWLASSGPAVSECAAEIQIIVTKIHVYFHTICLTTILG